MTPNPLSPVVRDEASAEFFDGTARGVLLLRRCLACAHVRAPEVPMCTECLSEAFEWTPAAGTGHLESWVVLHAKPPLDGTMPDPRIIATVELAEGPWITSALMGVDPDRVTGGMTVVVAFETPEGSEAIPVFRPASNR
jgi:uncharacterized OB-fold protein